MASPFPRTESSLADRNGSFDLDFERACRYPIGTVSLLPHHVLFFLHSLHTRSFFLMVVLNTCLLCVLCVPLPRPSHPPRRRVQAMRRVEAPHDFLVRRGQPLLLVLLFSLNEHKETLPQTTPASRPCTPGVPVTTLHSMTHAPPPHSHTAPSPLAPPPAGARPSVAHDPPTPSFPATSKHAFHVFVLRPPGRPGLWDLCLHVRRAQPG